MSYEIGTLDNILVQKKKNYVSDPEDPSGDAILELDKSGQPVFSLKTYLQLRCVKEHPETNSKELCYVNVSVDDYLLEKCKPFLGKHVLISVNSGKTAYGGSWYKAIGVPQEFKAA